LETDAILAYCVTCKGENVRTIENWSGFFIDLATGLENRDAKRMRFFYLSKIMIA